MEEFRYLRSRVDQVAETQARHTEILERNTESLVKHVKRTDDLQNHVRNLEWPFMVIKWLVYILGLTGTGAGAILAIKQLLQ